MAIKVMCHRDSRLPGLTVDTDTRSAVATSELPGRGTGTGFNLGDGIERGQGLS
jgi:hypothetical protein